MKKIHLYFSFFLFLLISISALGKDLKSGSWCGVLQLNDSTDLPFNFEVKNHSGKISLDIINAEERIPVDEISFLKDSIFIRMPVYDSEFRCMNFGDSLKGVWINHARKDKNILPFRAWSGTTKRFEWKTDYPFFEVRGKYEVTFSAGTKDESKAILIIGLTSTQTIGTVLTESGDYRYMEGILPFPYLFLSCFDGSHAFLMKGELLDGTFIGDFYSGAHGYETWIGRDNNDFELRNPDSLTFLKPGADKIRFSFPNLEGKMVSMTDEKFRNKVVIVQIMGSWCPNCLDESVFLEQVYQKNKLKGLEIEAVAFEKNNNPETAKNNLNRFKSRSGAEYEFLLSGKTGSKEASEAFPMLNSVMAFPTCIYIDKKGIVRRISTGFNGPATGKYYEKWKRETSAFLDRLLAE